MSFVAQAQDRYLSPFNADPEVRASLHLPQRVILNDLTLREGRQVEGLLVTPELLQRVARELEESGIPMLQLHSTPEHVRAIGALGLTVRTEVLTSSPTQNPPFTVAAHKERIDFILSHGLGLDLCFGTSDQLLLARQARRREHASVESLRERELDAALESVAYAKAQGGLTGTNLQDFLRADFDFLRRFCRELAGVGIDLITLDDFAAPAIPVVYRHVFQRLKQELPDIPLGIHVTNDFGLGTAVVLGALEGGAEVLDVGVNSYGEARPLRGPQSLADSIRKKRRHDTSWWWTVARPSRPEHRRHQDANGSLEPSQLGKEPACIHSGFHGPFRPRRAWTVLNLS